MVVQRRNIEMYLKRVECKMFLSKVLKLMQTINQFYQRSA